MNSTAPSSLLSSLLRGKAENRLTFARGGTSLPASVYKSALQEQHSLPSRGSKTPQPPPLQPTVALNPGAADCRSPEWLKNKNSTNLSSELDQESPTMTGGKSTILSDAQVSAFAKELDTASVKLTKRNFEKVAVSHRVLRDYYDKAKTWKAENTKVKADLVMVEKDNVILVQKVKEMEEYKTKYEKLMAKRKKSKKGNDRKDEQSDDVKEAITGFVRDVLFRTCKFARPGDSLKHATTLVWKGIKDKLKLDEGSNPLAFEDFVEIYDSHVLSCLSNARNYVATRSKIAADGTEIFGLHCFLSNFTPNQSCPILFCPFAEWMDENGADDLPTFEEIENVWNIPEPPAALEEDTTITEDVHKEREIAQKKHDRAVKVLVWWVDRFLQYAVGLDFWGPNIRPFYLMTDKMVVDGDPSGKEKVLVTTTSEAFAHLTYTNCRDKWVVEYKWRKENPKKKQIPKYKKSDPDTHKFQNKWSNSRTGQVSGGGWLPEALQYFEDKKKKVQEFREMEANRDNVLYKFVQAEICKEHNVKLSDGSDSSSSGSKKRKRDDEVLDQPPEVVDITFLDE